MTYSVTSGVLLLGSDDETLALSGVQSTLALDDGLADGRATTVLASNARDGVPVAHFEYLCRDGGEGGVVKKMVLA